MDVETVKHVATLARLKLSDDELARFAKDLTSITGYVDQLGEVDVDDVAATIHPVADRNTWREDAARESFKREEAVANAPEEEQNFFKVPPVID